MRDEEHAQAYDGGGGQGLHVAEPMRCHYPTPWLVVRPIWRRRSPISETRDHLRGIFEVATDMDVAEPVALSSVHEQLHALADGADEHD